MEGQTGEDQRTIAVLAGLVALGWHADAHGRAGEWQDTGNVECGAAGIV